MNPIPGSNAIELNHTEFRAVSRSLQGRQCMPPTAQCFA